MTKDAIEDVPVGRRARIADTNDIDRRVGDNQTSEGTTGIGNEGEGNMTTSERLEARRQALLKQQQINQAVWWKSWFKTSFMCNLGYRMESQRRVVTGGQQQRLLLLSCLLLRFCHVYGYIFCQRFGHAT